ncbi:DUF3267 domain-containing protein [Domibacillus epiphyticus]|uniref:DUF3267 domain-containing protein n=1 Tax=Domibacillus epiphyticus TaxID=1714355 RepID=A0A1V2A846_9BACI|nr:DUF3267 domain-containing protein [Domibacillus epiphyticus]OMP67136.1 hypothetical protein BTO28_09150 [Domibacillus epiphyticus]
MKCWRTFNFEKTYGFNKLFVVSILTTLLFFSVAFSSMQSYYSETLHTPGFPWFAVGLLAVYPLHKLIHLVPVINRRLKLTWERKYTFLPVLTVTIRKPVSKNRFMICLTLPFFVMTPLLLAGGAMLPHYLHYFTMAAAFHTGICAFDFLYLKAILSCPKNAFIEEDMQGFEILIPDESPAWH